MRKIILSIIIILMLLTLTTSVFAIRLSSDPFRPNPRLFEPGMEITKAYEVGDYSYGARPYLQGDLEEYAEIYNIQDFETYQTFEVKLTLPDQLDRGGIHTLFIGATEEAPSTGVISGLSNVRKTIMILVLFEEKTAKIYSLSTKNLNENQKINFSIYTNSLTEQQINSLWVEIKVYNFNNEHVKTLRTNSFSLESAETKKLELEFDSTGLGPGQYRALAEVYSNDVKWEGDITTLESNFNIGTLDVELASISENFTAGQINKMDIKIISKWNGKIKKMFADLFVDEIPQTSTAAHTLSSFEEKTLTGYLDLTYVDSGEHDLKIILNYDGHTKTSEHKITIKGEPQKETKEPSGIKINNMTIMMFLVIIVLVLVVIILIIGKKKK